jgi:hypothetical protein
MSPTPDHTLSDISLTTKEVLNTLLALDPDKATLKETAQQIAPTLTELFNRSLVLTLCLCIKRGINVMLRIIYPSHSSALYPKS